jgi:probable rRNA maturation factor
VSAVSAGIPRIVLRVESRGWPPVGRLRRLAAAAIGAAVAAGGLDVGEEDEVSLLFTDDAAMRRLNAEWRGIDKPTNVLAFPQQERGLLGDVVLAEGVVANEAALADKPVEDHISHLIIHGYLHLLGYDHQAEAEAERMEALEGAALRRIGVADPYAAAREP